MARNKTAISITLSNELIKKLDQISTQLKLSRSALIENTLKQAGIMKFNGILCEERRFTLGDIIPMIQELQARVKKLEDNLG